MQQATAAAMTKAGVAGGYLTLFVPKPSTGIVDGKVVTVLFTNPKYATTWFNFAARQIVASDRPSLFASGLKAAQSAGFAIPTKLKGASVVKDALLFAQGPYVIYVILDVLPSQTPAESIKLAGIVYSRVLSQL
jgi:hypothetical protein